MSTRVEQARLLLVAAMVAAAVLVVGCTDRPPVEVQQLGYRGLGMEQVSNPRTYAEKLAVNAAPEVLPAVAAEGPLVTEVYENVQVLKDLTAPEFARVMAAITTWVSPEEGCAYCHDTANMASDAMYTKVVSRRMLEMTRHLNTQWSSHVAQTGVTCYTCHRGQPVPANIWYTAGDLSPTAGAAANSQGQNIAAMTVGLTSLPYDPFTDHLSGAKPIRVVADTALPTSTVPTPSIKTAESSYALMMHLSQALGVNCTYCHNSRSFKAWDQSTPQRATAWYGIRMVRDLNVGYLEPLKPAFPTNRLGPHGDVPKVNCATCHQGVAKPLNGVSMFKDYPEFGAPRPPPVPPADAAPADAAAESAAASTVS